MYESYKSFLLSDELYDWIEWASAVKSDDVETFIRVYDPFDEYQMFDPIELAIAYDSEQIFNYLIESYDYSDFYNQMDFSLLIVMLIFEREHFLLIALENFEFSNEHLLEMYEFMILNKDVEYFKHFYEHYPVHPSLHKDLLRLALNNYEVFWYLSELSSMQSLVHDEGIVFDIIAMHPGLLNMIEGVDNLVEFMDTDLFMHVCQLDSLEEFAKALDFLLKRGFRINEENGFGLTLYHQALRFANDPSYVECLIERGADTSIRTSMGYPPAHQLIFRDAQFTLDLSEVIDFNEKDPNGLTLQDYDAMMRRRTLNYFDILSMVKAVLNMDESYFYELSEEEFYHLATMQGVDIFMPFVTLASFENPRAKEAFSHGIANEGFNAGDIIPLKDMFPGQINHDVNKTLQLDVDFWELTDEILEHFRDFALNHNTKVVIESEEENLNQRGQVYFEIESNGKIKKHAIVYSHLIDVYYLHFYFDIPLANIMYHPTAKKPERFLN